MWLLEQGNVASPDPVLLQLYEKHRRVVSVLYKENTDVNYADPQQASMHREMQARAALGAAIIFGQAHGLTDTDFIQNELLKAKIPVREFCVLTMEPLRLAGFMQVALSEAKKEAAANIKNIEYETKLTSGALVDASVKALRALKEAYVQPLRFDAVEAEEVPFRDTKDEEFVRKEERKADLGLYQTTNKAAMVYRKKVKTIQSTEAPVEERRNLLN